MGPRSLDRGILSPIGRRPVISALQWGRDLSIAESLPSGRYARPLAPRLQWGRDLSIAESGVEACRLQVDHCGFNGAAISRSRNPSVENAPLGVVFQASMGPRSLDRGIFGRAHAAAYISWGFNGAAISRSRNPHMPASRIRRCEELQWGRDLSIAESETVWDASGRSTSFNGAAISRSRNREAK